ncbi:MULTISPECIES: tetratricopeptide repeat protein [unclassified Arsukibacterium]|uniref:tetratricopeptide repeat protein n=1 Tax=unclassified Arsukibacterium TaxID=2635278 RepID=UPI0025BD65A0|nr:MULTISPECIES: sel1 repeat family protein [unclassified Arsukibacterium]|tara:strand:+ start:13909 stop:14685 length:777 start_codon:yes stop_codon:yes gene_type:complete
MRRLIKLARSGSGDAAAFVAMAYASGDGLEQNHQEATRFIKLGVRHRNPMATYLMSDWYRNGFVLEQNTEQADKLLAQAVKSEYAPALYQQAVLHLQTDDEAKVTEAVTLLEQAAEAKLMNAMFLLARLKQTGTATEQDLAGAGRLFKALTLARHPQARDYLQQVIDEIAADEQQTELVADFKSVDDIEVIQVRGQKLEANVMLDGLVRRLNASGKYDRRSIGSRISGVSCENSGSACASIKPGNSASSLGEVLSGGK